MKLEMDRNSMKIVPESAVDEAYLEEVFGLRNQGDSAIVIRENAMSLSCWGRAIIVNKAKTS
jgi:hypothetical protein